MLSPHKQLTIPEIPFLKKSGPELEFDVISLKSLFQRQPTLNHSLARPHRLQFYGILYITQGEGRHYVDFKTYSYRPGTIIFVAREQVHAYEVNPRNEGYQFLFTENFLMQSLYQSDILPFGMLFNNPLTEPALQPADSQAEGLLVLAETIRAEYQWADDFAKQEILSNLLKIFLLKAERAKRHLMPSVRHPERYWQFLHFRNAVIQRHTQTRNAMDYAAELAISYKHLNEICKEFTTRTAKEFIDNWVVLEIRRNLASSELSIKEITYNAGFDEPTNLIKYFRKQTGQTPSQFRSTINNR
ncbi:AraC family transcriptional regulator [Spirosoma areae]